MYCVGIMLHWWFENLQTIPGPSLCYLNAADAWRFCTFLPNFMPWNKTWSRSFRAWTRCANCCKRGSSQRCFLLISVVVLRYISMFKDPSQPVLLEVDVELCKLSDVWWEKCHQSVYETQSTRSSLSQKQENLPSSALTSSVTMTSGYLSSDRKLKMHQILKASSLEMNSWLWSRFFLEHNVQHILLKSWRSKLSVTWDRAEQQWRWVDAEEKQFVF